MWSRWFTNPDAIVVCVDLDAEKPAAALAEHASRRGTALNNGAQLIFEKVDLDDEIAVKSLAATFGPFDIILDDALHSMEQQQHLLVWLLPWVLPHGDGYYILEDLDTSFLRHLYVRR